ncbi:maltose excess protein 1, chloroplastic isoform X2 [Manihot esculenta]|uniref:Uncharacterized protein n=1 Tax=Manihot esculenta TaxID=3983 RepID=A0ACB7H5G4_MANES|nr:maltose excess protein 1, chloroplastic isoform X2 [Manihot esculenta]KAG8647957.1 hypothetical protein MANES_09G130400v8 [Manihot esculenta]
MARSLVVPAPSKHSSLFPNFPTDSHFIQSRTLPFAALRNSSNCYTRCSLTSLHRRLAPVAALESDVPHPLHQGSANVKRSKTFEQWDSWTAKFSGAANIPFLLLQMPQIILNAQNLMAGNKTALLAVPWLGMLTGLLGNLSLLSYFVKKKETEVIVVQTLGVISIFIVITQLAMAEAMPLPHFVATSVVVAIGLVFNFFNYLGKLDPGIWRFWEDFITVGGLSALPQARTGSLSEKGVKFVGGLSGWTATLLFMWMPVSQMWTNFLNPENIKGLSAFSMLLAMIGNGLMIPRAIFIRDLMWFTGSAWATLFYGYGNIVCMYCLKTISREFFLAATAGLVSWIGMTLWRDSAVYGYSSPLTSLKELAFGST